MRYKNALILPGDLPAGPKAAMEKLAVALSGNALFKRVRECAAGSVQ